MGFQGRQHKMSKETPVVIETKAFLKQQKSSKGHVQGTHEPSWKYINDQNRSNCQQTHEKMLSVTNHQGNQNQNHSEMSPHSYQHG